MKHLRPILLLAFCFLPVLSLVQGAGGTPQLIRVQGFLNDKSTGTPLPSTGTFNMTFELFDASTAGTLLASHGPVPVNVTNGLYEVDVPFPAAQFTGPSRFLQITVDTEILTPRIRLVSTPFAYEADTLDGLDSTDLEESAEITSAVAAHAADPAAHATAIATALANHAADAAAHHLPTVDTTCNGVGCDLQDPSLLGCDSIDTDATGHLICGTDAVGAPTAIPPLEQCFDADDMKAWEDSFASLEALDGIQVDTLARAFDRTVVEFANARLKMPADLDTGGQVTWRIFWEPRVAPATPASVIWNLGHRALSAGLLRDAAYTNLTLGSSVTGSVTGVIREMTGQTPVSSLLWQPNQMVFIRLSRDSLDPADTLDAALIPAEDDALLHMFCIEIPRQ